MTQTESCPPLRPRGIEARQQPRYRCRVAKLVRFTIKPSYQNHLGLIHDVSLNGVGVLFDQALEPGMTLALQLNGSQHPLGLIRLAQVMHVRRSLPVDHAPWIRRKPFLKNLMAFFSEGPPQSHPAFIYLAGCKFGPPLTVQELEAACGPLAL